MSYRDSNCKWCGKSFDRTKDQEPGFCFCRPECKELYFENLQKIEAKWAEPRVNPAYEQKVK